MSVKSRPGGRSARVKAVAYEAAAALIVERGHESVTMTDVAERADLAATSLYRRWGDIRVLLLEVAVERLMRERPLPDSGSLREDLRLWAGSIAANLGSREGSSFFRILVATALPPGATGSARIDALRPRIVQIEAMLERARKRGEIVPSVADVLDQLLAPIYLRALLGSPVGQAYAVKLADRLAVSGKKTRKRRSKTDD